jgi:hypothetical protein
VRRKERDVIKFFEVYCKISCFLTLKMNFISTFYLNVACLHLSNEFTLTCSATASVYSAGTCRCQLRVYRVSPLTQRTVFYNKKSLFRGHTPLCVCIYIYIYVCVCVCVQRDATMHSIYSLFHCKFTLHVSGALYTHNQEYRKL